MDTCVIEAHSWEQSAVKPSRAGVSAVVLVLSLLSSLTGCGTDGSGPTPPGPTLASPSRPFAGDGRLPPGEHLAALCGNGLLEAGEQCDDGNVSAGEGCTTACTLEQTQQAAPIITGPASDSVITTATPPLSGRADPGNTVTVREGSTKLCSATVDASGNWTCTPSTPLADGPHTVTATASDYTGSTSPVSNSVTFITDIHAPDTTIPRGPASRTEDSTAAFGYASNENGVRYECSLDGGAYAPCEDSYDVEVGAHTLRVRAVDVAGNVDATPAVYTWTVEEMVVEVEDTRAFAGGGCNAVPASPWWALLGVLGLRPRKRR